MQETDGEKSSGWFVDFGLGYLFGKVVDCLLFCIEETAKGGILYNMNQVDVKLWN